jgi:hypothetical protein
MGCEWRPKAMGDIAVRLLELEQRFESYCSLHEEELREIKATLNQLRKDILGPNQDLGVGQEEDALGVAMDDDDSREGAPRNYSVLTL